MSSNKPFKIYCIKSRIYQNKYWPSKRDKENRLKCKERCKAKLQNTYILQSFDVFVNKSRQITLGHKIVQCPFILTSHEVTCAIKFDQQNSYQVGESLVLKRILYQTGRSRNSILNKLWLYQWKQTSFSLFMFVLNADIQCCT